jgi:hypothetical protein
MVSLDYWGDTTPRPDAHWRRLTDRDRIAWAAETLTEYGWADTASVVTAVVTGTVTVSFVRELKAGERGQVSRAIEGVLQAKINEGITLSAMPKIDRNRLRSLRGVDVL